MYDQAEREFTAHYLSLTNKNLPSYTDAERKFFYGGHMKNIIMTQ